MFVITTPTGHIGSQLLPHLLQAGETVRVIVRNPAKLSPEVQGNVEVIQGSTDDPAVLAKALAGAEALFWVVPPPFQADDIEKYYIHFSQPACEAIKAQGVKRVVGVSSLGRDLGRNAGPVSGAHALDATIEATGVNYRALWNPSFMENMFQQIEPIKQQGMFFLPAKPEVKTPLVATRDIASSAAKLLLDKSWTGQGGLGVLGPEDLSYNDMAAILTEVLGKQVRYQQISGADYKERLMQFGASEAMAQGLVNMFFEIGEGLYSAQPRTPENTTPTSFRQWCEEVFKPAIQSEGAAR